MQQGPGTDDSLETYCAIGRVLEPANQARGGRSDDAQEEQEPPQQKPSTGQESPEAGKAQQEKQAAGQLQLLYEPIPEPDLSMEVEDWLKRSLRRHEALCRRELTAWTKMGLAEEDEVMVARRVSEKHADASILEMIRILRSFDPSITHADLAATIHAVVHSASITASLGESFRTTLQERLPRDRQAWLSPDLEKHLAIRRGSFQRLRSRMASAFRDVSFPVVVLCGSGASVICGAVAGACGLVAGTAVGTATGMVLAPFTFGLSVPTGAAIGSSLGLATGVCAGAGVGFIGGSLGVGVVIAYRVELQAGMVLMRQKALRSVATTKARAAAAAEQAKIETMGRVKDATAQVSESITSAADTAAHHVHGIVDQTQAGLCKAGASVLSHITDPRVSWAAGAGLVAGTGAGAAGLAVGGLTGAALGIVPAVFTFGLSIPVGCALGGGAGLFAGTTVGGCAGALGGRAAGRAYVGYFGKGGLTHSCLLGGTGGTH